MNTPQDFRPDRLLCVVAHPDDIEVTIGGTIAKWVAQGTEVCLLVCTDGANGTADPAKAGKQISEIRALEQTKAVEALGLHCWHQLDHPDGSIELGSDLQTEIVRSIREHKPDTVFTMDPTFLYSTDWYYPNHKDHRVVGQATFDAVYPLARDIGSFPGLLAEGFEPHAVSTLIMTNYDRQNHFVDVTDTFDKKIEALKCHTSQFGDAAGIAERLKLICDDNGTKSGCALAEAFVKLDILAPR